MAAERHDVLVLGGGSAGCVLAARLSENPDRSVCLVEAGPDFGPLPSGGWPADLLDAHQLPVSHDWDYDEGHAWSARVIGGCSTHNACMLTWGADSEYDRWGEGWSGDELRRYRLRAEATIGARSRPENGAWNDAVFDAACEVGFPVLEDVNRDDAVAGVGRVPVNDRNGVRWNAAIAYLDEARQRRNMTIVDRAVADRLELEGTRGRGAWIVRDGTRRLIPADRIILTAGAYGSPAILLRSGIGPVDDLRSLGITPVVTLPGVGANLQNHWTARVMLNPGRELAGRIHAEAAGPGVHMGGTVVKTASDACEPGSWDLHLFAICWGLRDGSGALTGEYVLRIATGVLRPRSVGRVALRSAGPAAPPLIDHRPLSDPDGVDLGMLTDGVRAARRIAAAPSLRRLGVREEAPGAVSEAALRDHVRASLGCYYHPVGTCAIGPAGDAAAVVGGDGAVYGLEGVHVADCSIMPTIPRANTHLTALAVAELLADRLGGPGVTPG